MRFKTGLAWLVCAIIVRSVSAADEPRVLIISIDGCRPDVALRAEMPNLRALMREGSFTFWATTTPAAITLPSHVSMLTGVTIERHGVVDNDDDAVVNDFLHVPSIFDLARRAGISTGMAAGKGKFALLTASVDHAWYPPVRLSKAATKPAPSFLNNIKTGATVSGTTVVHDVLVADHAVDILHRFQPRLMFVHFGFTDEVGHAIGWGTSQQIDAFSEADRQLGRVLEELRSLKLYDQTTIILSSDHGGTGRWHGPDEDRAKFIPWIIRGPRIRKNFDLSLLRELHVQTYDTFATACDILHLTPAADIDGKVIWQAFVGRELMKTSTPTAAGVAR